MRRQILFELSPIIESINSRFLDSTVNSAGYDLVVEIHRQLYNKILEDMYKANPVIAKKNGLFSYVLTLDKPPTVDRFDVNQIKFTIDLNIKIRLLGFISVRMDSRADIVVALRSNEVSKKLEAKLLESKLTTEPGDHAHSVVRQISMFYYRILTYLIDNRFAHHYEDLALSSNLYSFTLPELQQENLGPISVDIAKITSVSNDVSAILVNLLGRTLDSTTDLSDFTDGQDISFSLSADAIQRTKKYWWGNPNKPIIDEVTGKLNIKPDLSLEVLTRLGLVLDDLIQRHRININHEVKEWWLTYKILARFGEPALILKNGNELDIPGLSVKLDVDANLQLLAKNLEGKDEIYTAAKFMERDLDLSIKEASASIHLDEKLRIVAKLEKLETALPLKWGLPGEILDLFMDRVEEHLIKMLSDVVISPAIIREEIPGTSLHFNLDVSRIETSRDEVTIGGSLEFSAHESQ